MKEYISLTEKDEFFQTGSACISKPHEFDALLPHLLIFKDQGFVFRGVKEARFKLYNSGQRKFIDDQVYKNGISYREFIIEEIKLYKAINQNWLPGYLQNLNISVDNFLAVLSIMQHNEHPSPCLDFSFDPLVALYFSFYNCADKYNSGIDEFVSIYFLSKNDLRIHFPDLSKPIIEGLALSNVFKGEEHQMNLDNKVPFETLFMLKDPIAVDITSDGFLSYKTKNNPNIIKQKGILFFNSTPDIPFEEVSRNIFKKNTDFQWLGIKCINLHKNLKDHVNSRLQDLNITHESLFPDNHHN